MNRATGDFWKDWDTEDAAGVSPDRLRSATEESIAHIVQQARQILEIVPGERRLMPSFGCRIHQLDTVQTPLEKSTGAALIEEALERWAPTLAVERAEVDDIGDGWLRVRLKLSAAWCSFNMAHRRGRAAVTQHDNFSGSARSGS